jgi:hypothetical protein
MYWLGRHLGDAQHSPDRVNSVAWNTSSRDTRKTRLFAFLSGEFGRELHGGAVGDHDNKARAAGGTPKMPFSSFSSVQYSEMERLELNW